MSDQFGGERALPGRRRPDQDDEAGRNPSSDPLRDARWHQRPSMILIASQQLVHVSRTVVPLPESRASVWRLYGWDNRYWDRSNRWPISAARYQHMSAT